MAGIRFLDERSVPVIELERTEEITEMTLDGFKAWKSLNKFFSLHPAHWIEFIRVRRISLFWILSGRSDP